jgi:hypothetical protein
MNEQDKQHVQSFLSLEWYDEIVKFIFLFVTKTSELLLAAGIIVSTANFLTDGDVMGHNKGLSDAWSWAQAFAIDSSLGIVFMNAFEAVRERDKIKAIIFFTLTVLLATVAGLVTHFDAFAHVAGLSVTDKRVSGILPLWVMTALRSVAVIGFLLASRLKNISLRQFRLDWTQNAEVTQERTQSELPNGTSQIDYTALASALVQAMQQGGTTQQITVEQKETTALPEPKAEERSLSTSTEGESSPNAGESAEAKMMIAYEQIQQERANQPNTKPISARDLAKRANIRRSTCGEWLQKQEGVQCADNEVIQEGAE